MSVGFKLRPFTYSRMSHLPAPHIIDQNAIPVIGAPDYVEQYQKRWGKPMDPWLPFDSAPGLHDVEFIYFLENIAKNNPGWFEANGYGKSDGGTTPSYIEYTDAWYGMRAYDDVWAESKRLDGIVTPPAPPTPPTPPVPPTPPPETKHVPSEINCEGWLLDEGLLEVLPADVLDALDILDPLFSKNGFVWMGSGRRTQWGKIANFIKSVSIWG